MNTADKILSSSSELENSLRQHSAPIRIGKQEVRTLQSPLQSFSRLIKQHTVFHTVYSTIVHRKLKAFIK